ncbi:GIY-YIG nuclease family protein [Neobacillus notoginsengisoli]|uniref:GIY-YIG nuclease family protein n=1 Tax=Neobacillus notoginsengisoli TaxID=1578198 RepID=UPI001F010A75|nr:GIY-YIG nuclease family protein [Neobacillus notoginsengisoli]
MNGGNGVGEQLLKAGIYAIINKTLNLVYIGETEENFIVRWIEHIRRIPKFFDNHDRTMLYLHKDTKFIILKELDPQFHNRKSFYHFESEAGRFYKQKGWIIISNHTPADYLDDTTREKIPNLERYRKNIKQMIKILGLINTKNNNIARLYSGLYKKVNKQFNTDLSQRDGKNILATLKKGELLFVMMDLYPRYAVKHLEVHRTAFKEMDNKQLSLFN